MSKDMYDKNMLLKSEYAMNDIEKTRMLLNDKIVEPNYENASKAKDNTKALIKEQLNKKLKLMQEEVMQNKISLKQFEEYYILIKGSIATGLIDDILIYALSLADAEVLPLLDYNEDVKYFLYKKDMENIIAKDFRKLLGSNVLILKNRLNSMIETLKAYIITLKQFYDFCEALQYAMLAKIEGINYKECINALLNAKIEPPRTYDDYINVHNFKKKIASLVNKTEEPEKGKNK